MTIKITDVDEPPTFDSGAETVTVDEGVEIVRADSTGDGNFNDSDDANLYVAMDEDGLNVNLSLMGPDAADFSLSDAGVLSFVSKPDYENPADANRDNLYEVTVRATDGTLHADRKVRVTVENVNEAPVITAGGLAVSGSASESYAENGTGPVATYTVSGADADGATWSLSGDDAGDFRISGGVLSFSPAPDFESPADANGDNEYSVTVVATNAATGATDDQAVTVTVTDEAEAPRFPSATATRSVAENTAAGENIGAPVAATDDDGDTVSYSLGGADAGDFAIDAATGQLMTSAALDFETKASYSVTVTATAGGMTATTDVTITVTDVDEVGQTLLQKYDDDNSGDIDRHEVITAINDYLFGEGDDAITREDAIQVINLYLFGG